MLRSTTCVPHRWRTSARAASELSMMPIVSPMRYTDCIVTMRLLWIFSVDRSGLARVPAAPRRLRRAPTPGGGPATRRRRGVRTLASPAFTHTPGKRGNAVTASPSVATRRLPAAPVALTTRSGKKGTGEGSRGARAAPFDPGPGRHALVVTLPCALETTLAPEPGFNPNPFQSVSGASGSSFDFSRVVVAEEFPFGFEACGAAPGLRRPADN
jgi:hypothetical protein